MATAAEVRMWARDNGYDPPVKGTLPGHIHDAYDAAHPSGNGAAAPGPDYPDDDFESLFPAPEDSFTGDDGGGQPGTGETKPRKPRSKTKPQGGIRGLFPRSKAKPGKRKPRVSTEDLLGSVWRGAAKLATPLPPLQRTLRVQAPVAGLLLEDAVRDTVIDPLLQPFARLAEAGKTVSALVGPPACVTMMMLHMQTRAAAGQQPNPLFMGVAQEALRSSLMTWMDVAGPKFEAAMAREREFESKYGRSVDEFMAWIFSAPVDPADEAAVQAEEDAIARAQGIL